MKFRLAIVAAALICSVQVTSAESARAARQRARAKIDCSNVVSITKARGVLYKDSNLHGGRGLTALYQNPKEQTRTLRVELRTENGCRLIGTLGLFACDRPYGCRYYAAYGTGLTKSALVAKSRKDGSKYVLLQGKGTKWWRMPSNAVRAGHVNK